MMDEFMMGLRWLAEQRRLRDLDAKFERMRAVAQLEVFCADDDLDLPDDEPEPLPADWHLTHVDEIAQLDALDTEVEFDS